jgi:hypothetical protein
MYARCNAAIKDASGTRDVRRKKKGLSKKEGVY